MKNLFSLEGKNAWVTGAAYGIGFAIAKAFVEAGVKNIIFNTSNQASMEKGLEAYKAAGITNVHGYVCNVTDEVAVKELVDRIHKEIGQIDILDVRFGSLWTSIPFDLFKSLGVGFGDYIYVFKRHWLHFTQIFA